MELQEAIRTRRSIRKYTAQPVEDTLIEQILAAGMSAPSAHNQQPWEFIVVRKSETLSALSHLSPYAGMIQGAAAAIIVCGDPQREHSRDDSGYWMLDCSVAVGFMSLAAHALGLGSVWVAVYPREARITAVRQVINLPEHIVPFCVLPLGYPAESRSPAERFDRSRIHYERW